MRRAGALWNLGCAAIAAAGILLALQFARPLPAWSPPALPQLTATSQPSAAAPQRWTPDQIAALAARPLHQVLFDPPPVAAPAPPPPPRPALELVGTALGAETPFAIVRRSGTNLALMTLGDEIDAYRITQIERGRIQLTDGVDVFSVQVPWYAELAEARP